MVRRTEKEEGKAGARLRQGDIAEARHEYSKEKRGFVLGHRTRVVEGSIFRV